MKDKIHRVTDKLDTVEVILADQTFYKFRKGDFEAWAITAQLGQQDIIPNYAVLTFPVDVKTDRETLVYSEGKMGADLKLKLKRGVNITVVSKVGLFFEITFGKGQTGYIVATSIPGPEREAAHVHIMRVIFEQLNDRSSSTVDEKYIRSRGLLMSRYTADGYSSEKYRIGSRIYTVTKYDGRVEISSYEGY